MNIDNNANRIRKRLLIETVKMVMEDRLAEDIDRLPLKLFPRHGQSVRCCIHKDRAVTKYRLQAILGHRVEEETDELKPLSAHAREALERTTVTGPILTVIDEGCSSCLKARHFVTNVCRGCVARPCMVNCPKNAIQIVDGRAKIDEETCIDCGMCLRVCPYHAIVYVPVPCEDACPTNAISKDEFGREEIDYSKCIFCGKCMTACPFGAIMERSQIVDIIRRLKNKDGKKVVALLAPAVAGQFPVPFGKVASAVLRLGFDDVVEVAVGAKITAEKEAKEFTERMEAGEPFMTTSCCPAYTETVKKHVPELEKYVSETGSPMHYTGELVREEDPEACTVFIGPCVAKRNEALRDSYIDYVMTAEELGAMFVAAGIEVGDCEDMFFSRPGEKTGRGFPVTAGVAAAVKAHLEEGVDVKPVLVDGLDSKAIKLMASYAKGKCPGNLVEVMCCEGGCVSGPCVIGKPAVAARRVTEFAEKGQTPSTGGAAGEVKKPETVKS